MSILVIVIYFLTDYNTVNYQFSFFILTHLFFTIYKMLMICKINEKCFHLQTFSNESLFSSLFVSKTCMQNACFELAPLQRTHNHSKLSILLLIYHCLCSMLHRLGHVQTHSGGILSFHHVGEVGE